MVFKAFSIACISSCLLLASFGVASAKAENDTVTAADYFALVNGTTITKQDFQMAFQAGARKRFYHGKIPEKELQSFKQEISDTLIGRLLLVEEAKKRGIKPDQKMLAHQLEQYRSRYSQRPDWEQHKDTIIEGLTVALKEESLLQQLEKAMRDVPDVTAEQVQAFYQQRQDLFTTPEQTRISLILLKVAPSSGADVWDAAREEAEHLVKRLNKGSSFAEMARIHSGDPSAAKGGDMGFLHRGMLAPQAEEIIKNLPVGSVSEPVMLLRGVAIFKLEERQIAKLNAFDEVKDRAESLLKRELGQQAWASLLDRLKQKADIKIDMAGL